jgi:hypothetical protein
MNWKKKYQELQSEFDSKVENLVKQEVKSLLRKEINLNFLSELDTDKKKENYQDFKHIIKHVEGFKWMSLRKLRDKTNVYFTSAIPKEDLKQVSILEDLEYVFNCILEILKDTFTNQDFIKLAKLDD